MYISTRNDVHVNLSLRAHIATTNDTYLDTNFELLICGQENFDDLKANLSKFTSDWRFTAPLTEYSSSLNVTKFVFPLQKDGKYDLANLTGHTNLSQWFNITFPPCSPIKNVSLVTMDNKEEFVSPFLEVQGNKTIVKVKVDKPGILNFKINISSDYKWVTKNLTIEVCGGESLKTQGALKYDISY